MSDRAVASPVGVILLLGITVTAVTAMFLVGGAALSDTRGDAERSQTENAMAQFSSKASLVGLGESGDQRFAMGRLSEGDLSVEPEAGTVSLYENRTEWSERRELENTTFGAVVYRSGDREIAYQGGGVWQRHGEWSRMVSPPEYHYRLETLTFPIITVEGTGRAEGDTRGTVRSGAESEEWYPIQGNDDRSNPLDEGTVIVQIQSRYCEGWEAFFQQRSEGIVKQSCAEGDPDTVEVDLVVPFRIESDRPVKATQINPGTGSGDVPEDWEEDVIAPSVSPEVESRIEECTENDCETLPTGGAIGSIGEDELYWSPDDHEFSSNTTFETDGEDIVAVIDGDLTFGDDIDVTGDGSVTLYVRGDVTQSGGTEVNTGDSADQFATLVHTDADSVSLSGNVQYTGVMYAPGSTIDVNGNANVVGALVGETVDISGQPPDVTQAEEVEDYQIAGGDRSLTYLHVSENPIEVELD